MPPLTHQGLNTFGCYIDGELYVANDGDNYWDIPAVSGSFNEATKRLGLQSTRYLNNENGEIDDIHVVGYVTDGIGTYDYLYNDEGKSVGYVNWKGEKCDYYYREYPDFDIGELTITYLNEEENIIAGTFYLNLVSEYCESDTLMKITDGRFDFHY
ncbi:MAG: hypothetical protein GQ574_06405 [Crocinitomix sp.]|nr:hypothetical protein [Crocinitomix sp.]